MADLIQSKYFERPSIPQSGWMGKVPLDLWEVPFYAAIGAQQGIPRAEDSPADRFLSFQGWEQPGWIGKVPLNLWEVPFYAGTFSQAQSFGVQDGRDRAYILQTQPRTDWWAAVISAGIASKRMLVGHGR